MAAIVTYSGIFTCPISRSDVAIHTDMVYGIPIKNMMCMYFTASFKIRSACVLPINIRDMTARGKTIVTRKYGTNAANPITSLKRNACPMPSRSPAPKNCVMKMPPVIQTVLRKTIKTKRICPATFTPDMDTSPSPATMKLSTNDTRLCIICCSIIGTAIASALL